MQYGGAVYIITNKAHTVLYTGVTSNLIARINQHREKYYPESFSSKYNCSKLVYYKTFSRIEEAINEEKKIKKWKREWKVNLINEFNPHWIDLWDKIKE